LLAALGIGAWSFASRARAAGEPGSARASGGDADDVGALQPRPASPTESTPAAVGARRAANRAQQATKLPPGSGERGGSGLAILAAKALVCSPVPADLQVVDRALVLVKDGKIESVQAAREAAIPVGYEVVDVGQSWVMPGLVELHCHVAGVFDINDMVFLTNPELSARTDIVPDNWLLRMGLAGGITTVLYIPGSGTNMGGTGVLLKTGFHTYEEALVRDPGSLKLAQWGNPESWGPGVGMAFENWNTRNTFKRGLAYAKRWKDHEEGRGSEPERNLQWDVFRRLATLEVPISTHTQVYQVVLMTITMVKMELGLNVFLDHSEIGGWLTGKLAAEQDVPAIVGPRSIDPISRGFINWARNKHEGVRGLAAGWQELGVTKIGFNTDSPVIPEEELPLQAAMAVHYGFDESSMQAIRGLTVIPAMTANIADRVGSLTSGRDADILVVTGSIVDPRSWVERVWLSGRVAYDAELERRW
jgi:hypothetical protein